MCFLTDLHVIHVFHLLRVFCWLLSICLSLFTGVCFIGQAECGFGEKDCYDQTVERCNSVWNCPLHGGDERGCGMLHVIIRQRDGMSLKTALLFINKHQR